MEVSENERRILQYLCKKGLLLNKMSIVARHIESNNVAGFILANDEKLPIITEPKEALKCV
jgi:hypothetical protein